MAEKRKNGQGTVRLRKDGRWEGRVVVSYDERGYPKTKSVTAKTKEECIQKLKTLQKELGGRVKLGPEMPFGQWIDYWYQNYCKHQIRPNTQTTYAGMIYHHIIPNLGDIPLNKLTKHDLQQFYVNLQKTGRQRHVELYGEGLSGRTARACHGRCRSSLEKAVELGLIRVNPAIGCKLPPKRAREMQVLTKEELRRFLLQAKEEDYYELFLLELSTGMRRGELMALQWDDVDLATGEIHITKQVCRVKGEAIISPPKTKGSIRTVVIPEPVVEVLKRYREKTASRWLFPSPVKEDSPIDPSNVRRKLHVILEHAGCKQIRFHDLRHTFATMALEQGMDIKTLSAMIGHVTTATTLDIYAHITDTMRKEAARSIDRGMGNPAPEVVTARMEAPKTEASGAESPKGEEYIPYQRKQRKPGTGCVTHIDTNLWEGRYSPRFPDGKRHIRDVYAKTREECEEKLAELIKEVNAEREEIRAAMKAAG